MVPAGLYLTKINKFNGSLATLCVGRLGRAWKYYSCAANAASPEGFSTVIFSKDPLPCCGPVPNFSDFEANGMGSLLSSRAAPT